MRRVIISVAFAIVCALSGLGAGWYALQRPVIVLQSLREIDGLAFRGGFLDFRFVLIRNRVCDARVERWLWRMEPDEDEPGTVIPHYVPMPQTANPPTPVGVQTKYQLSLPVPANIAAGDWNYFSRTHDDCDNVWNPNQSKFRDSPNVPVRITEPNSSTQPAIVPAPGPVLIVPTGN